MTPHIGVDFATHVRQTIETFRTTPTTTPTPTGTPSPTPILYAVQPGDTIWTIAATSNRQVSDILAMNPLVRPEALQIGMQLLLPAAPAPALGSAAGTPIPIDVRKP